MRVKTMPISSFGSLPANIWVDISWVLFNFEDLSVLLYTISLFELRMLFIACLSALYESSMMTCRSSAIRPNVFIVFFDR